MKLRATAGFKGTPDAQGWAQWIWDGMILEYRTTNRKRALTLAMNSLRREWPAANRYCVEILEE